MPRLTFGRGVLSETGSRAAALRLKRVALFTDSHLLNGPLVAMVRESLKKSAIEVVVFSDIRIEPDDDTIMRAAHFLSDAKTDGVVSVGGGSVIDTAKGALLIQAHGGHIREYFAPPVGNSRAAPGPVAPHIACPTTSGTGSECTSISVIRIGELNSKFVAASPHLLPDAAIVDPQCCDSLPANIVASTGFDLLCHALECYTARAYTKWDEVSDVNARQYLQGANPFSDLGAREALDIAGKYLQRGVADSSDQEARDKLMWGATLAGIAFGNSGTHLPHAMSYGITHLMKDITSKDYTMASPFVPHGISVIVCAPSIFRYTAEGAPQRHMEAASFLSADTTGATLDDAGEVLAMRLIELMRSTHIPNGLSGVGFGVDDITALTQSSVRQKRAIANAPRESNSVDMENMYRDAVSYW
ncbi:hypothetical protein AB833_07430 [Chromatiales bacterium (ex Bugula neritina AB1)]|nr:hypothetical protein AB833_07430 [Chromatiales bacterium (ex Bugula neritina AB1)]